MPQPKQTKGGGKADGESQKKSTAEESPESTEEKSVGEIVSDFKDQDRDTGVDPVDALQSGEVKNPEPDTDESWNAPPEKDKGGFLFDQVKDERHLQLEERAQHFVEFCDQQTGRFPILVGLWVFVNFLDKDMETARSKTRIKTFLTGL